MLPDGTSITTFPDLTIDAPGSDGYKRWTDRVTEAQIIESEFELRDSVAGHFGGVSPDLVLLCSEPVEHESSDPKRLNRLPHVTQNKALPVFIDNPPTGGVLAGAQAEWIVAASYGAKGQVASGAPDAPIPTFGRVDFTDCTATTQSGQQLTSGSGNSLNMAYQNAPNDTPVCATTLNGSSEIWVDYTGDR